MSQQRRRKQSQNKPAVPDDGLIPTASPPVRTAAAVADEHGYLAIGLAAGAMAIVAVLTIMIIAAAT